jgi:hypothetical protein
MSKATNDQHQKTVLARLTPDMTREQIKRNLIAALERSGFTIHPSRSSLMREVRHDTRTSHPNVSV